MQLQYHHNRKEGSGIGQKLLLYVNNSKILFVSFMSESSLGFNKNLTSTNSTIFCVSLFQDVMFTVIFLINVGRK